MFFVKVINKLRWIRLDIRKRFSTAYTYLFCFFYGIKIGSNCHFWKRAIFYTEVGSSITLGKNCVVRSDLDSNLIGGNRRCIFSTHDAAARILIGDNCSFTGVTVGAKSSIIFGNNVLVGANSTITDFDWHAMDPNDRDNRSKIAAVPVVIEDSVWIGANVIVLKGVRIGRNTVIGSGSIVTRDMPPDSICAGNPCRVIRSLH